MKLEKFGGRRAVFRALRARIDLLFGRFGSPDVDWRRVERVVFVCRGNICRSPYAEARARLLHLNAISCGLRAKGKAAASPAALRVAQTRGVDMSGHRSRNIRDVDPTPGDLFVVMEPAQLTSVIEYSQSARSQVVMLGLIGGGRRPYLHDPYNTSDEFFNICFQWIDDHLEQLVREINRPVPEADSETAQE